MYVSIAVMNQKGFANIVCSFFVVVLIGVAGYFVLVKRLATLPTSQLQPTLSSVSTTNPNWKKYSGTLFEFEYPNLVSLKQESEGVSLGHFIAYKHVNLCDFKGDAPPLEKLSDFSVSLSVFNKNLRDTIQSNEGSNYIVDNFFENNTLKISQGFIDEFTVGSLKGFQITSGVEGCGHFTYYFPISSTKTLFVNRSFIPELSPISSDFKKYLNLSGIISPYQEKEFFVKIISSIKIKS